MAFISDYFLQFLLINQTFNLNKLDIGDTMENQIKRRKPSEYWGALTNDGVIYLMECGLTKGAYVTFLFMCQYIGDDGIYHGTIN